MARRISDTLAAQLLSSEEGELFLRALRFELGIDVFEDDLASVMLSREQTFQRQLRRATDSRIADIGSRSQTLSFRRSVTFRDLERRIGEVLRSAYRDMRDELQLRLTERIRGSDGLFQTRVAGARVRGLTTTDHFANWARFTGRRLRGQISLSLAEGASTERILQQINMIMRRASRDALTLTRTISKHVLSTAREAWISAQGFGRIRYIAILDDVTTDICNRLAGRVFEINQGPRPPQHFNCRSFVAPARTGNRELGLIRPEQVEQFTGQSLTDLQVA